MEKKAVSATMLTLILVSILTLAFGIQPVKASATIYIRPTGEVEGTDKIQRDGDLYTFTDDIFIDASGIVIERNDMTLDGAGHTLQGSGVWFSSGVSLSERSNVTIRNLQVKGFTEGIRLYAASNNSIHGNNITNHSFGITLEHSSNDNIISGNNITNNEGWGINLYDSSSNNSICGNSLTWNEEDAISLDMSSSNNSIRRNNISISKYGIRLFWSPSNNIVENNIADSEYGIYLLCSSNHTLTGNDIAENWNGIALDASSSNNISGNNIIANTNDAILLFSSSSNNVSRNNIIANKWVGVELFDSDYNSIFGNTVAANSEHGVWISSDSNYNGVYGNNITNNRYGITLDSFSGHNSIIGNNITNNDGGIQLSQTSNNRVYHNNLIDNTYQATSWDSENSWDDGYPSGGNYWSDYSINYPAVGDGYQGESQNLLGSDGIWDHPYEIDAGNQDNYPLTEPWTTVERKVGVKVGDWVKYGNFDVSWSSNDPDATMPVGIAILREVEWWENSVEDILDTKIRYQQLFHFKDGSEYSTTCWIDIDTGSGTALTFVSSGLVPDDCIYASAPWFAWKLNETVSRQYVGVLREVNCLNITTPMQVGQPPAYPNSTGNFCWDEETGVLCELSMKHLNQTGSYETSWSVFWEIADTNLWEAPILSAYVDIDPDTLSLRSKGKWITAYIQLPEGYNPADIDASSISLDGTIQPVLDPKYDFVTNSSEYLVDHNNDGVLERMVKFNRTDVASWISSDLDIQYGNVTLIITGQLLGGTPFEATDTVKVLFPGDVDGDADVDFNDFIIFAGCYGTSIGNPRYIQGADFNEDETIDYNDFIIFAGNYGKTAI